MRFSEGFELENTIADSAVNTGRQGSTGWSENTQGQGTQSGAFREKVQREKRPELNSKAERKEQVTKVGKVL